MAHAHQDQLRRVVHGDEGEDEGATHVGCGTVRYGDADFDEDRRALEALLATVPTEMHSSLVNKRTAKDAWDAIAAARIGSARVRRSTLQKLRQEWENLAFKPGENVDDFALRLNTLMQQLARYGDDDIDEERAVEKFLRVVPK